MIDIENGFRLTGSYNGPQTRKEAVENFVRQTINDCGNNHLLCGDLNAHHCKWEKACNERGVAVHRLLIEIPNTHIVAADVLSYFKVINKTKGGMTECSSNPDIGISRHAGTKARVENKTWGNISDHRLVIFTVQTSLKLTNMRRRVAKELFYARWPSNRQHNGMNRRKRGSRQA